MWEVCIQADLPLGRTREWGMVHGAGLLLRWSPWDDWAIPSSGGDAHKAEKSHEIRALSASAFLKIAYLDVF